ncbi:GntR family transcriptional regulator [Acrocarpospora sp. B8E8]|uniref:GntR family transcriptional regulator n=1 Tax=Acrocarpospora sp. B8E8 TaxID=3153572 RepID=UPI00325C35D0
MTDTRTEFERRRAAQMISPDARAAEAPDSRALRVVPSGKTGGPSGALLAMRRREIIDILATRIASGELREGARMPSVQQLMIAYAIPRSTAVRIQRELRNRRMIRNVPGVGFVVGVPAAPVLPPRVPVQDQITQIATELAEMIRTGKIAAHERVTTQRRLMTEHGISKATAWGILTRLTAKGWAYEIPYVGTLASPRHLWPPKGTSMALAPAPASHVRESRRTTTSQPSSR